MPVVVLGGLVEEQNTVCRCPLHCIGVRGVPLLPLLLIFLEFAVEHASEMRLAVGIRAGDLPYSECRRDQSKEHVETRL